MPTPPLPDWKSLSLEQQVAQLITVRASGQLFDRQIQYPQWEPPTETLKHWIQDYGVGGVILLGGTAAEVALRTQQLQAWVSVPLLIAADIEEGVGQRFAGATWMPPPMSLSAIAQTNPTQARDYAWQMGKVTAQEAWAIGLNWILAPVVDVNNNPLNPVINVRSFGETPKQVSELATAFIQGAHSHYPVLTTAKHFPGHGDTATDSHLALPIISHSQERLDRLELMPFRAAIAAGVSTIMTAHLQVPALDPEFPATLSPKILTHLLRQSLQFQGLIVTDALVMQAITQHYGPQEACLLALEAGADILLMPVDPPAAIAAICEAIQKGRISLDRLHQSLTRIWQAKHQVFRSGPDRSSELVEFGISPLETLRERNSEFGIRSFSKGDAARTEFGVQFPDRNAQNLPDFLLTHLAQPDAIELTQAILHSSLQTRFLNSEFGIRNSEFGVALSQSDPEGARRYSELQTPNSVGEASPQQQLNLSTPNPQTPNSTPPKPNLPTSVRVASPKEKFRLPNSDFRIPNSTNLILLDNFLKSDFLKSHSPALKIPQQLGYTLQWVDSQTLSPWEKGMTMPSPVLMPTLLQIFIRGNPFRGTAGLTPGIEQWFKVLLETEMLQALILYGSPYAWDHFVCQLPPHIPAIFSYGQMPAAQTIALNALLGDTLRDNRDQSIRQAFTT
jgi:beta-glucosidase-like glycosyl hydrolase